MSELIIGKWRMIAEEPADDAGGIYEQQRRLVELRADGTYHAENFAETYDDTWTRDGETLIFARKNKEPERAEIERVDEERLVLLELTPEVYQRDGPPRKVRNTYRRVSEAELGPMLGKRIVTSGPGAGSYAASYEYRMSKYPTMEITVGRDIGGRARLELRPDGTVAGCVGVKTEHRFSRSKYASPDGKHHSRDDHDYWLVGFEGEWKARKQDALVRISKYWRDTCDRSEGRGEIMGPIEMECVAIAANEKLPVDTLACKLIKSHSLLQEIALNPADSERAGPYTLQVEPRGRIRPDTGDPWWLLGAEPGLEIESEDERRAISPVVTFERGEIDFVESRYKRREPRPE